MRGAEGLVAEHDAAHVDLARLRARLDAIAPEAARLRDDFDRSRRRIDLLVTENDSLHDVLEHQAGAIETRARDTEPASHFTDSRRIGANP